MAKQKLKASFTLRKDMKKKWLKALRSGKYKQGTGVLFDDDETDGGYCCLGVLAACSGFSSEDMDGIGFPDSLDNSMFTETNWCVPYKGRLQPLNELNDCTRLSFKQIANIIERTVGTH